MRRAARQQRREERREDRTVVGAAAIGAAIGDGVAVKVHEGRHDSGTESSSSSDDESAPQTFAMREKLLTFGDDFTINKMSRRRGRGKPTYYVNNKVLRARGTFILQSSRGGDTLYQIQERKLRIRDSMAIEDADGKKIAEIKKRSVGVVRDNFVVKVKGDTNWQVHGSILEHNFTINENGREIVKVHKKWVAPIKDCYFIDIHGTDDAALALMVVIGLEALTED